MRTLLSAVIGGAIVCGGGLARGQTPAATPESLEAAEAAAPAEDTAVPTVETLTEEGPRDEPYAEPGVGATAATIPGAESPGAAEEAARLKIWTSPEMVEARAYVEEYGRRSVQFNSQAAQRYLAQLRQASPLEMKAWLERYAARRARTVRSESVARAARQTAVDQTLTRLQAVRQSYENFNQGQTAGALAARDRLQGQQQIAGLRGTLKQSERNAQLASQYATNYDWIINPPLWVKQRAAAASVPGDLPAGDPRNFLRGDVPVPGDPPGLGAGLIDPAFAPDAATGGGAATAAAGAAGGGEGGAGGP